MENTQLYASVKAAFVSRRTSLNRWCLNNGVQRQNARAALLGEWTGDKANELRTRLIEASGIDVRSLEELTANLTANLSE